MKAIVLAFLVGLAVPFAYAYQAPERVAEFGIKLAAFRASYVVDGYARDIRMQEAAYVEEKPVKGKKR